MTPANRSAPAGPADAALAAWREGWRWRPSPGRRDRCGIGPNPPSAHCRLAGQRAVRGDQAWDWEAQTHRRRTLHKRGRRAIGREPCGPAPVAQHPWPSTRGPSPAVRHQIITVPSYFSRRRTAPATRRLARWLIRGEASSAVAPRADRPACPPCAPPSFPAPSRSTARRRAASSTPRHGRSDCRAGSARGHPAPRAIRRR